MKVPPRELAELEKSLPDDIREELARSRVILTGCSGFLGSWLFPLLQRTAKSVVGYDVNPTDGAQNRDARLPIYEDCDVFIHAAGIASPIHYQARPLETIDVAVNGTRVALDVAHRTGCKLLFTSTSEIYGDPDASNIPTREDYWGHVSCRGTRACYDESKRMAETLVQTYAEKFGVHAVTVRIFNSYGPGLPLTDFRVLSKWAGSILRGDPMRVFGSGEQTRTFCYAADTVRGCLFALFRGERNGIYNVGNDGPELSIAALANEVAAVVGPRAAFEFMPSPSVYQREPQRRCPDITRLKGLGWTPSVQLDDGLRRFFLAHGIAVMEKAA